MSAQIAADSRGASSIATGILGALFVLRGFAYSVDAPSWTQWINPLGWMQETRPAAGNHWWQLLLGIGFSAVMVAVAFRLQSRRDFGQGMIAPHPGPPRGRTLSALRLALRLNAGLYVTWTLRPSG